MENIINISAKGYEVALQNAVAIPSKKGRSITTPDSTVLMPTTTKNASDMALTYIALTTITIIFAAIIYIDYINTRKKQEGK